MKSRYGERTGRNLIMATQLASAAEVGVHVTYGLGGIAEGRFARDVVAGKSARELIRTVVESPQAPGPAARTARVLCDVLRRKGVIDAELAHSSSDGAQGRPIRLDDVVLKERHPDFEVDGPETPESDEFTIRISESYRGGSPCSTETRCGADC
jgi:hypothetical protein